MATGYYYFSNSRGQFTNNSLILCKTPGYPALLLDSIIYINKKTGLTLFKDYKNAKIDETSYMACFQKVGF